MPNAIQILFEAQKNLQRHPAGSPERLAIVQQLNAEVPAPLLAHFLRLAAQGRPGVTLVRNGVCSGCHIRVPAAVVHALVRADDVHLCEHCSAYLLLPAEEAQALKMAPVLPGATRRPKARRIAAAAA